MGATQYYTLTSGFKLAYDYLPGQPHQPDLVFLHGYRSDRNGEKVQHLKQFAQDNGFGLLAFDNLGHGDSEAEFSDCTLGQWLATASEIIQAISHKPQILIGSSMGAWLALLLAKSLTTVRAVITIAAAPDFTEDLLLNKLSLAQKQQLAATHQVAIQPEYSTQPFIVKEQFITEAREHLLLCKPIAIHCPVYLLHGEADTTVSHTYSLKLAELLTAAQVVVTLVKDGDHRLSRSSDMRLLTNAVEFMSKLVK